MLKEAQLQGASLNKARLQGPHSHSAHSGASFRARPSTTHSFRVPRLLALSCRARGSTMRMQGTLLAVAQLQGASLGGASCRARPLGIPSYGGLTPQLRSDAWSRSPYLCPKARNRARNIRVPTVRRESLATGRPDPTPRCGGSSRTRFQREICKSRRLASHRQSLIPRIRRTACRESGPNSKKNRPTREEYQKSLPGILGDIGCKSDGAPYVIRGLLSIALRLV